MSKSRQLAAIMFTDIVGFTSFMGSDEQKTFEILEKNRKIHKPIISEFNGKWIKELGDGVMASFNTVSDAVSAAIKIQETCNAAKDFQLRIGIHQGEVVFENNDVFGETFAIENHTSLENLDGFINLNSTIKDLIIGDNAVITDISGLQNINSVTDFLDISDNPMLSECAILPICEHLNNGLNSSIGDNGSGCNTEAEIISNCE